MKSFLAVTAVILIALSFTGCATDEEAANSTIPWSTPTRWEGNKLPSIAPQYGERTY